ncbi:MAG TPA: hypothetical protein VFV37_06175 [Luteibaculaceae bacterium]|nr:hypothetical protein [Luteibaculaceae bacterium]
MAIRFSNKYRYLPYVVLIQTVVMMVCTWLIEIKGGDGGLGAVAFLFRLFVAAVVLLLFWVAIWLARKTVPRLKTEERKERLSAAIAFYPLLIPISILLTLGLLVTVDAVDEGVERFQSHRRSQKRQKFFKEIASENPTYRFEPEGQNGLEFYTPSGYHALADVMSSRGPIHIDVDYPDTALYPNHALAIKMFLEAGLIFADEKSKKLALENIAQRRYRVVKDPDYDQYRIYFNPGEKSEMLVLYGGYDALLLLDAGTHKAP